MSGIIPDSVNLASVAASTGSGPFAPDRYTLAVTKGEFAMKEQKSNQAFPHGSATVEFTVVEGINKGRKMWASYHIVHSDPAVSVRNIADYNALCVAVGRVHEQRPGNLVGKVFSAEVGVATDKASPGWPDPKPKNVINKYLPLGAPGSIAVNAAATPSSANVARPVQSAAPTRPATAAWGANAPSKLGQPVPPARPVAPVAAIAAPVPPVDEAVLEEEITAIEGQFDGYAAPDDDIPL